MKISVIIPAYNVEKYIDRCISSIVNQTRPAYEVIVINDGSTDYTDRIIDAHSIQHKNITVMHIENSGVSAARNIGLLKAKGDYITFCDADDWYDHNVLENLAQTVEEFNCDMVVYGRKDVFENKPDSFAYNTSKGVTLIDISKEEYLTKYFATGKHTFSVCNKLYKSQIIKSNLLLFNTNLNLSEDTLFNLEYLNYANKICEDYRVSYNRLYRNGSAIYKRLDNFYFDNIKMLKQYTQKYSEESISLDAIQEMYYLYGKVGIYRVFDLIDGSSFVGRIKIISSILKHRGFRDSLMNKESQKNHTKKDCLFLYFAKKKKALMLFLIFSVLAGLVRKAKVLIR
jgi:glycosyltransferase involved in cell wall biosynthesis